MAKRKSRSGNKKLDLTDSELKEARRFLDAGKPGIKYINVGLK